MISWPWLAPWEWPLQPLYLASCHSVHGGSMVGLGDRASSSSKMVRHDFYSFKRPWSSSFFRGCSILQAPCNTGIRILRLLVVLSWDRENRMKNARWGHHPSGTFNNRNEMSSSHFRWDKFIINSMFHFPRKVEELISNTLCFSKLNLSVPTPSLGSPASGKPRKVSWTVLPSTWHAAHVRFLIRWLVGGAFNPSEKD